MDHRSAATELTSADKTGRFESPVEYGTREFFESSLTAAIESRDRKPLRLRQLWLSKWFENQVDKLSDKISLADKIPFYLIACLLSVTALAKMWMLLTDPFADIRVGIPQEILWITVAFELWLAFENWRIRDYRVLALIDSVTFALFSIVAATRWALGYASCGCAGNFEIPTWIFLVVDLSIVAWFMTTVGQRTMLFDGARELAGWWSTWTPAAKGRLAGLFLFAGFLGILQLPIAAPLRASVLGEPPIQAIVRIDGDLLLGKECKGHVEIWNRSNHRAEVVGVERSCRCFNLSDDPIELIILPQNQVSLPIEVTPIEIGPLHQRIVLFLEHPIQFRMNIDVLGSVKGVD